MPIGGLADRLVFYAYEDGADTSSDNLVRMRSDGSIVWKAQPPEAQDAWVDISLEDDEVIAKSWSCWRVTLSATTGAELHRVFTK